MSHGLPPPGSREPQTSSEPQRERPGSKARSVSQEERQVSHTAAPPQLPHHRPLQTPRLPRPGRSPSRSQGEGVRRLDSWSRWEGLVRVSCAEPAWPRPPPSSHQLPPRRTQTQRSPLPLAPCILAKREPPPKKTKPTEQLQENKVNFRNARNRKCSLSQLSQQAIGHPVALPRPPQGRLSGPSATLASKVKGVSTGRRALEEALQEM